MIFYVTTRDFSPSVMRLQQDAAAPSVEILPYDEFLSEKQARHGTYIFSNTEALSPGAVIQAARVFRRLQEEGCRVLNDPAHVRGRFSLLRALYESGQNPFNVYLVDEGVCPKQFPVFLRVEHAHQSGPLTELIADQATLDGAIDAAICAGFPRNVLLIVEYAAQPKEEGVFAKGSVYKIGDRFVPDIWWHGKTWNVTGDQEGLVGDDAYNDELRMMHENSFAAETAKAFEIANIDYGRVDFGLIDDRLCIYEINNSPLLFGPRHHPIRQRVESLNLRWSKLISAFEAIDTDTDSTKRPVDLTGKSIKALTEAQTRSQSLPLSLTLSIEHTRRGNSTEALEHARAAVAAQPKSLKAQANLGRLLADEGCADDAICIFEKILEVSPRSIKTRHQLVELLLETERVEAARDQLIEAATIEDAWTTRLLLGVAYKKLEEQPEAQDAIERSIELATASPYQVNDLSALTRELIKHDFLDGAICTLRLLVKLKPELTRERRRLANLLLKRGLVEEARDHLIDALAFEDHWQTNVLLGRAYKKLGDHAAAVKVARHASALAPEESRVEKLLIQLARDTTSSRLWSFLDRLGLRRAS